MYCGGCCCPPSSSGRHRRCLFDRNERARPKSPGHGPSRRALVKPAAASAAVVTVAVRQGQQQMPPTSVGILEPSRLHSAFSGRSFTSQSLPDISYLRAQALAPINLSNRRTPSPCFPPFGRFSEVPPAVPRTSGPGPRIGLARWPYRGDRRWKHPIQRP